MNFIKKLKQICLLIFLVVFITSCDRGCVEKDQFDIESAWVSAYPYDDGVYGSYDPKTGGQSVGWHDTGLLSSGEEFITRVYGSWTGWNGNQITAAEFDLLSECEYCSRRAVDDDGDLTDTNCICHPGEVSTNVVDASGNTSSADCTSTTDYTDQNDPAKCTCTTDPTYYSSTTDINNDGILNDGALEYGVYHIVLARLDKYGNELPTNKQFQCRLAKGMGLNIALFGSNGSTPPWRAYNMYSLEETCDLVRDANGACLDDNGDDQTKYIYRSANNKIFMKDDKNGNNGSDIDTSDDEYHTSNEVVKIVINDRYYNDNYGTLYLEFYKGVGSYKDGNTGLLEFMVGLVEDTLLGEKNDGGYREGGIIEFMYKSIVQDSNVILVIQIILGLYISFYGLASLLGFAKIDKKELMSRTVKVGLVVFFTSASSWGWYNEIFVGFFKDGMDSVITMLMDLSDSTVDSSSMVVMSQMDRADDVSNATRFSYVDLIIKKLLSKNAAKKIFGLFFGEVFFGMIYIPMIYALIGYFIFIMMLVASIYLINLMKIVFALSLGPIFICFSLFSRTSNMFKNWISFLGARSLEIIILFSVLYMFLYLIDKHFTSLLYYRACMEDWTKGILKWYILKSHVHRSVMEWILALFKIGGLLAILQLIIAKVGSLSSALISINGVSSGSGSSFAAAGKMMGEAFKVGGMGAVMAGGAGAAIARKTGVLKGIGAIADNVPGIGTLRKWHNNSYIDGAIAKGRAKGKSLGLEGKALDEYAKKHAMNSLMKEVHDHPSKMAAIGLTHDKIEKRFDEKFVKKPLRDFIKKEAKKLKDANPEDIKLGKDMRDELKKRSEEWARKNLSVTDATIADNLNNLKKFIRDESELTGKQAASKFAGSSQELKDKYMQHLADNERANREAKAKRKEKKGKFGMGPLERMRNITKHDIMDPLEGKAFKNSQRMARDFERNLKYNERTKELSGKKIETWGDRFEAIGRGAIDRSKRLQRHLVDGAQKSDRMINAGGLTERSREMKKRALENYFEKSREDGFKKSDEEEIKRREDFQRQLKKLSEDEIKKQENDIKKADMIAEEMKRQKRIEDETKEMKLKLAQEKLDEGKVSEGKKMVEEVAKVENHINPEDIKKADSINSVFGDGMAEGLFGGISKADIDSILSTAAEGRDSNSQTMIENAIDKKRSFEVILKTKQMSKKIKEFELEQAKRNGDSKEIDKIEAEISSLEGEIKIYESNVSSTDSEIKDLESK